MSPDDRTTIAVTLNVHAHDEATATRVVEALSRPLVGFAFDDLYASLSVIKVTDDE